MNSPYRTPRKYKNDDDEPQIPQTEQVCVHPFILSIRATVTDVLKARELTARDQPADEEMEETVVSEEEVEKENKPKRPQTKKRSPNLTKYIIPPVVKERIRPRTEYGGVKKRIRRREEISF